MHLKKNTFGHYLLLRKPQTENAGLSGHQAGATGVPGEMVAVEAANNFAFQCCNKGRLQSVTRLCAQTNLGSEKY